MEILGWEVRLRFLGKYMRMTLYVTNAINEIQYHGWYCFFFLFWCLDSISIWFSHQRLYPEVSKFWVWKGSTFEAASFLTAYQNKCSVRLKEYMPLLPNQTRHIMLSEISANIQYHHIHEKYVLYIYIYIKRNINKFKHKLF